MRSIAPSEFLVSLIQTLKANNGRENIYKINISRLQRCENVNQHFLNLFFPLWKLFYHIFEELIEFFVENQSFMNNKMQKVYCQILHILEIFCLHKIHEILSFPRFCKIIVGKQPIYRWLLFVFTIVGKIWIALEVGFFRISRHLLPILWNIFLLPFHAFFTLEFVFIQSHGYFGWCFFIWGTKRMPFFLRLFLQFVVSCIL